MTLSSRVNDLAVAVRGKFNAIFPKLVPEGGTAQQALVKNGTANHDVSWGNVWTPTNDGSGSGLNADLLDGDHGSAFAKLSGATFTGGVTATGFTGPGGGLTGVNAANLGGQSASSYALLSGATFTGAVNGTVFRIGGVDLVKRSGENFTGPITATNAKFSAYVNYDQYIGADTWTKIALNADRHNAQSVFAAGTSRFTAPRTGVYSFGAGYLFKLNSVDPRYLRVGLSVNGATPTEDATGTAGDWGVVDGETQPVVTGLLSLTVGDTVEAQAFFADDDGFIKAESGYLWGLEAV